jgi:hypothetical protein
LLYSDITSGNRHCLFKHPEMPIGFHVRSTIFLKQKITGTINPQSRLQNQTGFTSPKQLDNKLGSQTTGEQTVPCMHISIILLKSQQSAKEHAREFRPLFQSKASSNILQPERHLVCDLPRMTAPIESGYEPVSQVTGTAPQQNKGHVHLAYNSSYSACFFSRNSIFLS